MWGRVHRRLRSNHLPAEFVSDLTRLLRDQRAFRLDQLARLDEVRHVPCDPVRREVDTALREAARLVLSEIEAALRRIELGRFGRCTRCGELMSVARLEALPMSTWCGSCHQKQSLAAAIRPRRADPTTPRERAEGDE